MAPPAAALCVSHARAPVENGLHAARVSGAKGVQDRSICSRSGSARARVDAPAFPASGSRGSRGYLGTCLVQMERACNLAFDWIEKNSSHPHMVLLSLHEPTPPYRPPAPFDHHYSSHPYDGEIAGLDEQIGLFINRLKSSGLFERSLIIFAAPYASGPEESLSSAALLSGSKFPFSLSRRDFCRGRRHTCRRFHWSIWLQRFCLYSVSSGQTERWMDSRCLKKIAIVKSRAMRFSEALLAGWLWPASFLFRAQPGIQTDYRRARSDFFHLRRTRFPRILK